MHGYALIGLVFLALIALVLKVTLQGSRGRIGLPYVASKTLFSAAEQKFLAHLEQAVGSQFRVFGKVRIADVAHVKPGLSRSMHQAALNRIASKHFDFVVCRPHDLAVVCAVELNDRTHGSKRAKQRDAFVAEVCQTIGLPLWTVAAAAHYSPEVLSDRFRSFLDSGQTAQIVTS